MKRKHDRRKHDRNDDNPIVGFEYMKRALAGSTIETLHREPTMQDRLDHPHRYFAPCDSCGQSTDGKLRLIGWPEDRPYCDDCSAAALRMAERHNIR